MDSHLEGDEHHPVLLQTTVVNHNTGEPVYTLIRLPHGTTIESLASILQRNDEGIKPKLLKNVIALGKQHHSRIHQNDEMLLSSSLKDSKANSEDDEPLDDESRGESVSVSCSDDSKSEPERDNALTPPSSPGVATFLSLIPESQRAGCHNGHKATILGGRYVLQKTNSRARLTGPFFCNACGLRFDWHSSARMHLNFHNRDFEACDKCQKRNCPETTGVAERSGRPPRCNVCNKSFYLWKTYLAHQEKHKDKVKCPLCCKFFQSLHNVGRHYYDEHNGVPVSCSICGNGYRAFKQYQTHVETMHMNEDVKGTPPPSDDAINYSIDLPTLQQLDPSIRVFSSVERICPVPNCGRIFSTQHTMQRHIYDVHSNELLPCGICGNAYRTYSQFERHCELFHGENFRVELPVGEINLPLKRKRESVVSEGAEFMKKLPPLLPKPSKKIRLEPEEEEEEEEEEEVSPINLTKTTPPPPPPLDEPLDMTLVKQEPHDDVILPD